MSERVLVASFKHESKTGTDAVTTRSDFTDRLEFYGDDIRVALEGTNTEIGGAIDVAEAQGVELEFTIAVSAEPGGPVERGTYEHFVGLITDAIEEEMASIDGILLPLHGAMVPEHLDDGEGPLVRAVRDIVGESVPIVVTIDPNANIADELVETADAIVAFEETPHVDMGDTGRTGMQLVIRAIRDEIDPVMHIERPPVIPSAVKSTTLEPPMTEIHDRARELEAQEGVLKANICQGFWSADIPDMGFSVVAVTDGRPDTARMVARDLAELVWDRREGFIEETISVEDGVAGALEQLSRRDNGAGPIVLAEMHDNPGGGSPADGTKLLRAFLEQRVTNAGLAIIRDPAAVSDCLERGVGERITLDLGGKNDDTDLYGGPIHDLDGYIKAITDGRFYNTGPMLRGVENQLGRAVRLQCGRDDRVEVIVTENRVQARDTEVFRHVGILPERLDLIGVKSAVHFRADYGPIASEIVSIDESESKEYERITRPKYPLDPMAQEDYPPW